MTDVRHREIYRVWYKLEGFDTEYAFFVYAVDTYQAEDIAKRRIAKEITTPFKITKAEKR